MTVWQQQLSESVTTFAQLAEHFDLDPALAEVCERFPLRLTPYLLQLCKKEPSVAVQFLPDLLELNRKGCRDPLNEDAERPVPSVIHRYPDRLLIMASAQCAANCRFCTRKGRVKCGKPAAADFGQAVDYVRSQRTVNHVILSGGDPLMLNDEPLFALIDALKSIDHVKILRIHSRIAATLPQRITRELVKQLAVRQPLYIIFHFNHPEELTAQTERACRMLADAGIPLGNQSVLLKDVNNNPLVMRRLVERLLEIRIRPYYLHQSDGTLGTCHFAVPAEDGRRIIHHLRTHTSGLGIPRFVQDEPGNPYKRPLAE